MKRFNYETRKYEEYNIPTNWRVGLYSRDLDKLIDCACCGKPLKIKDKYRSLEIHDETGEEYTVCKRCYKEEWVRNKMHEIKEQKITIEEMDRIEREDMGYDR